MYLVTSWLSGKRGCKWPWHGMSRVCKMNAAHTWMKVGNVAENSTQLEGERYGRGPALFFHNWVFFRDLNLIVLLLPVSPGFLTCRGTAWFLQITHCRFLLKLKLGLLSVDWSNWTRGLSFHWQLNSKLCMTPRYVVLAGMGSWSISSDAHTGPEHVPAAQL